MRGPQVYYLAPDYDAPSWGVGLLYHHVRILRELGFEAFVVHKRAPFRLRWLDLDVPIRYLDSGGFQPRPQDLLVVPEVLAHDPTLPAMPCRRIVFVQGSFLILNGAETAIDYRDLGYEEAIAVLPHVRDIVARHCGLTPALVPPFVAPYFFAGESDLSAVRRPRVLLAGKPEYEKAGYPDYDIARKVLRRHLTRLTQERESHWDLVELRGYTHRQTAEMMKRSALLLNLSTLEAFNTTVSEALAAGCIAFCYEAYGGRDYLRPGENAYVWPNNYIYPLLEQLCDLLDHYDERQQELAAIRAEGYETACRFQEKHTASALEAFYRRLVR